MLKAIRYPAQSFVPLFFISMMKIAELKNIYYSDERTDEIAGTLSPGAENESPGPSRIHLKGICGSATSLIISAVAEKTGGTHLVICSDKEEAAYFYNDLENLNPGEKKQEELTPESPFSPASRIQTLFYPTSTRIPYQVEKTDNANVLHRAEVLNTINTRFSVNSQPQPLIIVSYPEALSEKVVARNNLVKNTMLLKRGERVSIDFISDLLFEFHFERVEFVTEPGQFAIRGGIADIFSFSNDFPYRIEFSGETVESIRSFDPATQLSKMQLDFVTIIPNVQGSILKESRESLFDFLPQKSIFWFKDLLLAAEKIEKEFEKACTEFLKIDSPLNHLAPEELFLSKDYFLKLVPHFSRIEYGSRFSQRDQTGLVSIKYNQSLQPSFRKNFDLLNENLLLNKKNGYKNIIAASSPKQIERLYSIFEDLHKKDRRTDQYKGNEEDNQSGFPGSDAEPEFNNENDNSKDEKKKRKGTHSQNMFGQDMFSLFTPFLLPLHEGFLDHENRIACYTDHQIFERYHRFHLKEGYNQAKQAITLKELTGLQKGDYVTHIDHGIGVFDGLEIIDANGKPQEAIRIRYKDNDILYVSIHSLHRIAKYSGKEGAVPKINKLGTGAWQALKQKTKKKIKELAFDLVKLYAKRKAQKGFEFSPDSYLQNELEASFIYEDTPDQLKATQDVKKDMEAPYPMDRLICGDVGFGKTEIAIRAAFKAVTDGKQVAVLAPTTILTLQHYHTFSERLKDFPCTVDYINRFKSTKQQKETVEKTKNGKIDILIGTHRLIGKDIQFKDLGLLIIDEEQKFGVGAKEKLRTLRENVDTLTLTATPIPRTLQFSLMGARDLSIINTPPPNRYPVQTEVHTFNEETIRDAVSYEISRSGQVFFVHNKIHNIKEVSGMVQRLVPDARIAVAHGQMEGHKLEEMMLRFVEEDCDVLVSTAIIESGLDIPNANTIIINDAHHFGLSDLHQLRGRVGRSNKKAFCYLLTPPFSGISDDARKRLHAIEKFSDLGSGFNISLRDLDIRGAGNMLGAEQSGFITEIGYEMYQKILNEAMEELKMENGRGKMEEGGGKIENEIETHPPSSTFHLPSTKDCQVETDFEIMLPSDYVNNVSERMALYKELSELETEEELARFEKNLLDRFGTIPFSALDLIKTIRLRWVARESGFEKLVLKSGKMIGYLTHEAYGHGLPGLDKILNFVKKFPNRCRLKERDHKLSLIIEDIESVQEAVRLLNFFV